MSTVHHFVVPALDGPITGGTLYNRELVSALNEAGFPARATDLDSARALLRARQSGVFWIDSLFLSAVGELAALRAGNATFGLIAHYLPSLVRLGEAVSASDLREEETVALGCVQALLVTSGFMKSRLMNLSTAGRPVFVLEPGRLAAGVCEEPLSAPGLAAVMIANLTEGKGIAPFLLALSLELRDDDAFSLEIIGSPELEPRYAVECQRIVREHAALSERVTFRGALSPQRTLQRLAASRLLLSASRMESFGMALAEARTLGVPIQARAGGNVRELVPSSAGGEVVGDESELACACVRLARAPVEYLRRAALARAHALAPRSWSEVAREFVAQTRGFNAAGA